MVVLRRLLAVTYCWLAASQRGIVSAGYTTGGEESGDRSSLTVYENYSFDFSAHTRPIAYTTFGNTLELVDKVKLNPEVADRGGAYLFDGKLAAKDFEIDLEFTMQSELKVSRGFMILLTQQEMLEEEFMDSVIGYRQDYEGIAVYVFRHPHREDKWFVMMLQNQGARNALRLDNQMYSGLRGQNYCEIDMEQGVRAGLRIRVNPYTVSTQVKDSDDVSYRKCSQMGKINKNWLVHNFAIAAKNSADDQQTMMNTDVDIDSIQMSNFNGEEDMYFDEDNIKEERDYFLIKKHSYIDEEGGESTFDLSRIFELNLSHDLAKEQKKTLAFLNEGDSFDDMLFKHHQMLRRIETNFFRFNEQLTDEIHSEEDFEHHLISSTSLIETQSQLEELYGTAEVLKGNLSEILEESRTTLDQILATQNMQKNDERRKSFDASQVKLDPAVMDSMDRAHSVLDNLIRQVQSTLDQNKAYLADFENSFEQGSSSSSKTASKNTKETKKRLDSAILDEVEIGVRLLKEKIVAEYVESTSTLTWVVLVGIFAGLAFTFMKVNKLINKAHFF